MSVLRKCPNILILEMADGHYLWPMAMSDLYVLIIVTYVCLKVELAVAGYSINKTCGHKSVGSG